MSRDFHSLDRLRLDKYLYLLRCYVGAAFEILIKRGLAASQKTQSQKSKQNSKEETENGGSKKRKRAQEDDGGEEVAWSELETYISMLEEGPLCPVNFDPKEPKGNKETKMAKGPEGIRYHLIDIWLDELEKVAAEADEEGGGEKEQDGEETTKTKLKPGVPMELLLRPFETLREKSPNKVTRNRAAELLEDQRLVDWGVKEPKQPEEEDSDDVWAGFD